MSMRWFGFDFSQLAFASSVFASPGRMSYLSKSKNTSTSSGTAAKSCTAGRAVLLGAGVVVAAVGVSLCTGAGAAGGVAAVVLAEPVGAGAAACVVAGRLAQPLSTTAATSNDESTRCEQRVSMTSPFGVRWSVRFFNGKRVSRQARRPRRTCRFAGAAGDGLLGRTVGQHREDLPASVAIRLEREVTAVGRPRCALVVGGATREAAWIRAVHVHDPEVVRGPARRVDERVTP